MGIRGVSSMLLQERPSNITTAATVRGRTSQTILQDWLLTCSSIDKKRPLPTPFDNNKNPSATGHDGFSDKANTFHENAAETPRVMVVDDEPDMVRVMKYGLAKKGYDVTAFTDPLQALDHFRPGQYNVVLLDIRMPKIDGIELYRRIRAIDSEVVICFVSAYEQYKRQFEIAYPQEQSGCFIPKPVRMDNLAAIISSRIEERRQRSK